MTRLWSPMRRPSSSRLSSTSYAAAYQQLRGQSESLKVSGTSRMSPLGLPLVLLISLPPSSRLPGGGGCKLTERSQYKLVVFVRLHVREDGCDPAFGVHQNRRAAIAPDPQVAELELVPDAVGVRHAVALIREQREGEAVLVGEGAQLADRIGRDAEDHPVCRLVVGGVVTDAAGLRRAAWRVGLQVEVERHPAPAQRGEADRLAVLVGEREVGGGSTRVDHSSSSRRVLQRWSGTDCIQRSARYVPPRRQSNLRFTVGRQFCIQQCPVADLLPGPAGDRRGGFELPLPPRREHRLLRSTLHRPRGRPVLHEDGVLDRGDGPRAGAPRGRLRRGGGGALRAGLAHVAPW